MRTTINKKVRCSMVIYERGQFAVATTRRGFVAYSKDKNWKDGHTHLRSKKRAKDLIRNVLSGGIPRHYDLYSLGSLKRLSNDENYQRKVTELIRVRRNKGAKLAYRNSSGKYGVE